MKTAISIPDETFRRVNERAAALNLNRSQFFARAVERYLDELDAGTLTEEINAALDRGAPNTSDPVSNLGLERLSALTAGDEW